MKTVCIMGGGLGGLMTGALLAQEGYRVTVLEKNGIIGGGLQSFCRGGYLFDTGMHIFGGMGADGQLRRICRHLGIEERVEVEPCHVALLNADTGERITHTTDCHSPLIDLLRGIAAQEPVYALRPTPDDFTPPDITLTAKQLIDETDDQPELKAAMASLALFYGGRDDSPALLHALISCAHIDGTYTFKVGSLGFAKLLAGIIEEAGGEVHCGEAVTSIETSGREVSAVRTATAVYTADHYVNDMPVARLLELTPADAFAPAFRCRIGSAPYSMSAMTLFIGLKPRSLRYSSEACLALRDGIDPWHMDDCTEELWPNALFAIASEDAENTGFANTITAVCPMKYDYVQRWENSITGHRPDEYYRWKERMVQQALAMTETIYPQLKEAIAFVDAGTPLTIRDYYGTPRGAMYGLHRSSINPMQSSLSTRTRLGNLYLTGQDVNFHGLLGTSLTAILTAEAIVGRNVIMNKLIC